MARPNFLPSSSCLMMIIIILITGTQNLQLVNGDTKLIFQICTKDPSPDYCIQCLGRHINETAKQLGATSLDCSLTAAETLSKDFADCIEFGKTPKFRDDCSVCLGFISRGISDLVKATNSYSQNQVPQSAEFIRRALNEYQNCLNVLGPALFPQPLANHLKAYSGYTKAALGVLQQL